MKKGIILLLGITSSVAAMDLGQSFYWIHAFLQKQFSRKSERNNSKEIDLAHQAVRDYAKLREQVK